MKTTETNQPVLPHIIYYREDHSDSVACTSAIAEQFGATYSLLSTWPELTGDLEQGRHLVCFHIDTIVKSGRAIREFVHAVHTIARCMTNQPKLRILVIITPTTTQQQIRELKNSCILGLGLDMKYYPMSDVLECVNHLIAGTPCWPEHIIAQLPSVPLCIYFRKGNYLRLLCHESTLSIKIDICEDWDQLDQAMKKSPEVLVLHITMMHHLDITITELMSMIETRMKLAGLKIPVAVIIEPNTTLRTVKDLQQAGVFGILPSIAGWGQSESAAAMRMLRDREAYWSRHIINQLPGNVVKKSKSGIHLSPRQIEIANLIRERGLSNKQIARALNISENTVKMHVGNIMRAHGVRSRTQLAVLA